MPTTGRARAPRAAGSCSRRGVAARAGPPQVAEKASGTTGPCSEEKSGKAGATEGGRAGGELQAEPGARLLGAGGRGGEERGGAGVGEAQAHHLMMYVRAAISTYPLSRNQRTARSTVCSMGVTGRPSSRRALALSNH